VNKEPLPLVAILQILERAAQQIEERRAGVTGSSVRLENEQVVVHALDECSVIALPHVELLASPLQLVQQLPLGSFRRASSCRARGDELAHDHRCRYRQEHGNDVETCPWGAVEQGKDVSESRERRQEEHRSLWQPKPHIDSDQDEPSAEHHSRCQAERGVDADHREAAQRHQDGSRALEEIGAGEHPDENACGKGHRAEDDARDVIVAE
jgi:hypothetical protein